MIKALAPEEQSHIPMTTQISDACLVIRKAHARANTLVGEYEAELLVLEKRYTARLEAAAQTIADATAEVEFLVASSPDLFVKPKTAEVFGIKVGWVKQPGQVMIENEPDTIARIEKALAPKEAAGLIKVTKKLVKKALSALPGDVLKKIGVAIGVDTDLPVVKPTEGDAAKKLAALLKEKKGETPTED